ncbi:Ylf [Neorhizobium galegae bv. officinalis]|nr:Ylf [Neorhizobium galegae bv. officinalis]
MTPISSPRLPSWTRPRTHDITEADAAFAAGIALKSLDDLIRTDPPWLGCWRDRLALKSAAIAARMVGRNEDEHALRDAILLTAAGDDPGPAGKLFLATRMLARQSGTVTTPYVKELAALLGMNWDNSLALIPDMIDSANQSGRAAPFAVADLITAISAVRPDAEVLALGLAEVVLAHKLNWSKPVPLLLPERFGPAFRTIGGRGRVRPGEPAYPKAICLALVEGVEAALRSAVEIDRRAARLLAVVPKVRTKGAEPVIRRLLTEDAVPASAPGSTLSRWAANRLFDRLESFEAARELSGRSSFRIFGL